MSLRRADADGGPVPGLGRRVFEGDAGSSADGYRPDIDGLRAVAVLLVLLYHAGLGLAGGFVGVDVFFVISGFLITGIIVRDLEAGRFSVRGFWARRVRRIAPAAVVLAAAVLVAGAVALLPGSLVKLAESAIAYQLLAANVYFSLSGGYFDGPADMKPLLHSWSLGVEEQFYLLFPLLLRACRRLPRRALSGVIAALFVGSLSLSVRITDSHPTTNFYWLFPRAWELLLGALLAVAPASTGAPARARNLMGLVGLAMIVGSACLYSSATVFPGVTALVPTVGATALLRAGSLGTTATGRLLSAGPLVWVGRASYSIYLWHWPILVFLRHDQGRKLSPEVRCGAILAALVVGFLSWRFVEEPIRRRRVFSRTTSLIALYVGASACLVVVSVFYIRADGLPGRPIARAAALAEAGRLAELRAHESRVEPGVSAGLSAEVSPIGVHWIDADTGRERRIAFLLWGDSHAVHVFRLCHRLAERRGLSGLSAARGGFTPLFGVHTSIEGIARTEEQVSWNEQILGLIRARKIRHVIMAGRWESKLRGVMSGGRFHDLMEDALTKRPSPEDARRVFLSGLSRTFSLLDEAGAKVWFLNQVPVQDEDLVASITRGKIPIGKDMPAGVSRSDYQAQQGAVWEILGRAETPNVSVLGPSPHWFDDRGRSRLVQGGKPCYDDDNHLSDRGAEVYFRPLFEPMFDMIAEGSQAEAEAAGRP